MLSGVFAEYLFRALILFIDELLHFVVYTTRSFFRIGFRELFLIGIVREIRQSLTHTQIGNHTISTLGGALEVIECTTRDASQENFFGSASSQCGADFIEHLFFGGDAAFFRQIPSSTQGLSSGHNRHFNKWIGVLDEPRHRSVSSFVDGNGSLFLARQNFCTLFQTSNDAIHSV